LRVGEQVQNGGGKAVGGVGQHHRSGDLGRDTLGGYRCGDDGFAVAEGFDQFDFEAGAGA
jgi:hypothetical protein